MAYRKKLEKINIINIKEFMCVFRSKCKNYTLELESLYTRSVETTYQDMKNIYGSNLKRNNTV